MSDAEATQVALQNDLANGNAGPLLDARVAQALGWKELGPITTSLDAAYEFLAQEFNMYSVSMHTDGTAASVDGEWWPFGLSMPTTVTLKSAALTAPCAIVLAVVRARKGMPHRAR